MKSAWDVVTERYTLLTKTITEIEKKLKTVCKGRLRIKHQKQKIYYYCADGSVERFIPESERAQIEELAQKKYLEEVLRSAQREKTAMEQAIKHFPEVTMEQLYDQLPQERKKYTKSIIPGDDAFVQKWLAAPYKAKPFKKGAPVYMTLKGERVRSKSEVIIADRLFANGIPYKYECPLQVGDKVIHPDFSILKLSDRKVVYYEHCGMMDDPDYSKDMVSRVNDYNKAGIYLGDRLFLSFETSDMPLDESVVDNLINAHFR